MVQKHQHLHRLCQLAAGHKVHRFILSVGGGHRSFYFSTTSTVKCKIMGTCSSLSRDDAEKSPTKSPQQSSTSMEDPYLKYGGAYAGDAKDTSDFKYVTYSDLPKFLPAHKSAMAKYLTAEVFERLKNVKSSKGYTLSNAIMTG